MGLKIAVLGGGASGMAAAIAAARAGAEVAIVEHNHRLGKKILATGNGKCNFTNKIQKASCYRGKNPAFAQEALALFGVDETLSFFEGLGIMPKERDGYYYPAGGQAAAVADLLALEVQSLGIRVFCDVEAEQVSGGQKGGFYIKGKKKKEEGGEPFFLKAARLILACGGQAAPSSGSDGSGYQFARGFGHRIVPVYPALVQLRCKEAFYPQLAGVRTEARVRLFVDGKEKAEDRGELQLTSYGLSGIPVFQVSRFAAEALGEGRAVRAVVDLMPSMSQKELVRYFLSHEKCRYPGLLNNKLLEVLFRRYGTEARRLALGIKEFTTDIVGCNSFAQAQVTAGGVDTTQVNGATMESKLVKGLYFAGELLDVDGICGGYNLQWAWTSGYLAGSSAAVGK